MRFFGKESYEVECGRCNENLTINRSEVEVGQYKCPACGHANSIPEHVRVEYKRNRADEESRRTEQAQKQKEREERRAERDKRREQQAAAKEHTRQEQLERRQEAERIQASQQEARKQESEAGDARTREMERAIARQKSYVGAAVLVLLLYCLFYLPGLIVNCLYLYDARKTAKVAGTTPTGVGCLWIMLLLGLLPLMVIILLLVGVGFGGC